MTVKTLCKINKTVSIWKSQENFATKHSKYSPIPSRLPEIFTKRLNAGVREKF
jgi:hypothetical protein